MEKEIKDIEREIRRKVPQAAFIHLEPGSIELITVFVVSLTDASLVYL